MGTAYPYTTTIRRPGLPDVYLGFPFQHQAEHASWSLADDLRNTAHVDGTTVTWGVTPTILTPLAPMPTDPYAVAELIQQEDGTLPTGHAFPDTFSRLKAQEGYKEAQRIHHAACLWLDRDESEGDER